MAIAILVFSAISSIGVIVASWVSVATYYKARNTHEKVEEIVNGKSPDDV